MVKYCSAKVLVQSFQPPTSILKRNFSFNTCIVGEVVDLTGLLAQSHKGMDYDVCITNG